MNQTGRTIAKNASVLMFSQLITWGATLVLTFFLPRYLGVEAIGIYHLANSLWIVVGFVASFGMDLFLTKEVARDPGKIEEYFGTSIFIRVLLFLAGVVFLAAYVSFADYSTVTVQVIAITGIVYLMIQFTTTFETALRGLERMEFSSLGLIAGKITSALVIIVLLLLGYGVITVAFIGILAELINLAIQYISLRRIRPVKLRVNWGLIGWMLKAGFPYLMVNIFIVLYQQVDIVIISLLINEQGVGWYGAADRLFGTFLFIPTVLTTAIYPALSRLYQADHASMMKIIHKSYTLTMILCTPIGLGIAVIARSIVVLLYGADFANSGIVLALMGISLIFTFNNMVFGRFLISMDRQRAWTWVIALCTLATIPLDLVFVPWCQRIWNNGAAGGALAFLVTEPVMTIAAVYLLPKGVLGRNMLWVTMKIAFSGLVMVASIWWLRDAMILFPILIGGIVYSVMIVFLRIIPQEDWFLLKDMASHFLQRFHRGKPVQAASVPGEK